ncbi:hypothetical protein AK830_g1665 [Neonectria ditissima]|uniref:Uncharacterized protein n=1 Tax=Neonectria ditissima TaxID=78410 RepID=A0A0P7BYQ5_9HYPO|nr:hypothetical protein AK830_g1665 [Neonectria ditissima]
MAPTTSLRVLFAAMLASTSTAIQVINVVWSTTGFSTISGPSGNENSHASGFSLIDQDGNTIYSNDYPGDYAPCQGNGHTFTLSGGCFAAGQQYEFECTSKFDGSPESCQVLDSSSNVLGSAKGNEDTTFIGISIGQDGYCGTSFGLGENVQCLPDSEGFIVS